MATHVNLLSGFKVVLATAILAAGLGNVLHAQSQRSEFKIDPKTPFKDLSPVPPKLGSPTPVLAIERLSHVPGVRGTMLCQVPEVCLEDPEVLRKIERAKQDEHIAHQTATINHINREKADRFVELLQEHRPDLAGLPFARGAACRLSKGASQEFARAGPLVRDSLLEWSNNTGTKSFLLCFKEHLAAEIIGPGKATAGIEDANRARIAALMQILVGERVPIQKEMVQYLSRLQQEEATRALARLTVFPFDDEVRQAALQALKKRDTKGSTDLLLQGLRYPYPAVAKHAAEAVIELKRTDLVPDLVAFLDEPDPLVPRLQSGAAGGQTWVVREVVRINHHRNCLLCHAPGNTVDAPLGLTGPVPTPGEVLPAGSLEYYHSRIPDLLVRADVTYLRQDFTQLLPVENASPWPELQRYDFLVRSRELTADEAAAYQDAQKRREPGYLSPNHRAALTALQQLTGRQCAPTAEAWRRELGLPEPRRAQGP
jgi:hypothetical protein